MGRHHGHVDGRSPIIDDMSGDGLSLNAGSRDAGFMATPASGSCSADLLGDGPAPRGRQGLSARPAAIGRLIDENRSGAHPTGTEPCYPLPPLRSPHYEEFTYYGDATVRRSSPTGPVAEPAFYDYVNARDNPFGLHRGLWFHQGGCHERARCRARHAQLRHQEVAVPHGMSHRRRVETRSRLAKAGAIDRQQTSPFQLRRQGDTGCTGDSAPRPCSRTMYDWSDGRSASPAARSPERRGRRARCTGRVAQRRRREPNTRATEIELYDGLEPLAGTVGRRCSSTCRRSMAGSRRRSWPSLTTRHRCGRLLLGIKGL